MKLTNHLSQLFQKETDKALKGVLGENPDLLKKYVDGGLTAISVALAPINAFMRHLLVIQGLDPDSEPGAKSRELINQAMTALFQKTHEKDFEDDYDVSWVRNKFGAVQNKLNMTQDRFMALTDLSRIDNTPDVSKAKIDELIQVVNPVAPEVEKRELPLGVSVDEHGVMTYSQNAIEDLRNAVAQMEAEMGKHKSESKKKKSGQKTLELKVTKKKLNKKASPGARVKRMPGKIDPEAGPSSLTVQSDRKNHEPSTRGPSRSLRDLAFDKKAKEQAAKEATPEFQAEASRKLARATELTNIMVQKGLVEDNDAARDAQIDQMKNWSDLNFEALERVVHKYAPTKNAIAENKFKGSFRRVER